MTIIQTALGRSLERMPELFFASVVREKLAADGIDDPDLIRRIVEMLLAGREGLVAIETAHEGTITFGSDDLAKVEAKTSAFLERLPEVVERMVEDAIRLMVSSIREQWSESRPSIDEDTNLRARIASVWGLPIDALRLLLHLCQQEGEQFNHAQMQSKLRRNAKRNALLARLHIRACRIAREIILLIEYGLAEGAGARWRTLHETTVTATLIAAGGDEAADRYVAHEAVERKRALDDHRRAVAVSGGEPAPRTEADEIEQNFASVIRRYGRHFQGMYGWAGGVLDIKEAPAFHDLQERAGALAHKLRFRLACFDTHASPQTLSQPVHNWDPTTYIAGNFAPGFETPIADTAWSMADITLLLFPEPWDVDSTVLIRTLAELRDDVAGDAFRTARRIERDEQRAIDRALRHHARFAGPLRRRPR